MFDTYLTLCLMYFAGSISTLLLLLPLINFLYWNIKKLAFPSFSFMLANIFSGEPFGIIIKNVYNLFKSLGCKHGGIIYLFTPLHLITDLKIAEEILVKHQDHFSSRGVYTNPKIEPLGVHVISAEGETWSQFREIFLKASTLKKLKITLQIFKRHLKIMNNVLEKEVNVHGNKVFRIDDVCDRFYIDYLGDYVMGIKVGSLENSKETTFKDIIKQVINYSDGSRKFLEPLKLLFPNMSRLIGLRQFPEYISDFFLEQVKNGLIHRENSDLSRQDFLQFLIETKKVYTLEDIAVNCFSFFVGSLETTSTSTAFALYELSKNPKIQEQARDEARAIFKKFSGEFTYEAIQNMTFLSQVLSETLRKYPPNPVILRKCSKKFKFSDYVEIEEGTVVFISNLGIHYDEEYYPDPEKFDPSRFSDENKLTRPKFSYLPFGGGSRKCTGELSAQMQMKMLLASLLLKYKFTLNCKTRDPLKYERGIVLKTDGGIWIDIEKF